MSPVEIPALQPTSPEPTTPPLALIGAVAIAAGIAAERREECRTR